MDLKAVLAELSEAVPLIPKRVAAVREEHQRFTDRVRQLSALAESARGRTDELREQARQALDGLAEQALQAESRLAAAVSEVEARMADGSARIRDESDALEEKVSASSEAMDHLAGQMAQAADETAAASEQVHDAVAGLAARAEGGSEAFAGTVADVAREASAVGEAVHAAASAARERAAGLRAHVDGLLEQARGRIARTLEVLQDLRAGQQAALDREGSRLEEKSAELLDEVEAKMEQAVTLPLGAAVEDASAALAQLGQQLGAAQKRCLASRGPVDQRTQALQEALDPLPAAIDAVRVAADRVGLSWS